MTEQELKAASNEIRMRCYVFDARDANLRCAVRGYELKNWHAAMAYHFEYLVYRDTALEMMAGEKHKGMESFLAMLHGENT